MQLQLAGIHDRKNLGAERAADQDNDCAAEDEIGKHDGVPPFHDGAREPIVPGTQPVEGGFLRLAVRARIAQHPDRQHRHKGTGKQIRPYHREADSQGQRYEQVVRSAGHEEGRNEHRQNAEHGDEPGQRRLGRGLARGTSKAAAIRKTGVDVLDGDCRLVDQDADGQRQPTQGHDVDCLTRYPERRHRREDRERNVQGHDERTSPIPQKQQHHETREHGTESAFDEQAPDGARYVGGLVELVTDLDIIGQHRLEAWQVGFDGLDDRECRSVRSFGYGDVDRAASVHQRVAGLDVGAVFDRSDITYEDRLRSLRADRNVAQTLEIPDNGIDRHHRHEVADADVTGWANRVTGTQRLHHLVRRHVVGTELIGVQANEDGALARTKGRRRRHTWQGGEQRAHLEERRVLKLGDRFRLAGEDEVADWNATPVEPHYEWRHGSRGHEGPGAVDVGDRLRRGLRHVGAGMELELDQPDALDRFAFDMLDAGDVEEVVLIIVDDEPFHLRRDIQDGHPEIREDVPRHSIDRQKTHQCDGYDHRQKRNRASQCKRHQVHQDASAGFTAPSAPRRRKLGGHFEEMRLICPSKRPTPEVQRLRAVSRTWTANRLRLPGVCRPRR